MRKIITYCLLLFSGINALQAQDCNASFYAEPVDNCINCFHFINTSQTNINSEIYYYWDMGDGNNYQSENVTHQFNAADNFDVNLSISVPICTGILEISADGGVPPYEFQWSNGYFETTDSLSVQDSLCPGDYQITISDAMGTTTQHSIVLSDMTGMNLSLELEYENCLSAYPDSCIGSVTAIPQGGTPPYYYEWNTGSTNQQIDELCAGFYSVTVCDANDNCTSETIELPLFECGVNAYIAPDDMETCNGHISFQVNGGSFPYTYNTNPDLNYNINPSGIVSDSSLCTGLYIIEVTDANGEVCFDEIKIKPLSAEIITENLPTIGQCNGTLHADANYGTPPYTYTWSTGSDQQQIENLCSGWYYLTLCDSQGICRTDSVELLNQPLANNINWRGPSGPGACDGYIYAYAQGGVAPYNFSWEPTQNSLDGYDFSLANELCEGTYILTSCDSQDSCVVDTIYLTDKPFNVDFDYVNPKNGLCNGKITSSVIGAAPPYNFLWSNGDECLYQTECNITNLCPDTYYVTICDFENNCIVDSVTLYELPLGPEIIAVNQSLASPETECNASALIEAQGQEPLHFNWSTDFWTDGNLSGIENQCAGTYYFTICDDNQICITDSIVLNPVSSYFSLTNNPYNDDCNGSLEAEPYGGYPPYQYEWSNNAETQAISNLCPDWYYVTIADQYNNQYIDSIELVNQSISPLQTGHSSLQYASISGYCTESSTQTISTDYFTSIRGNVYFGTSLLPKGVMLFYTKNENKYTARQLCPIINGKYRIEQLQYPAYYAMAIPVFMSGFEYFPVYYPTYFGNEMNVSNANEIVLYDTISKDIYLAKSENIQHGSNEISGQLIYSSQAQFESNIFLQNWYELDPPGTPQNGLARHIPVYLRNENGDLLKYQLTDHNGSFHFKHLTAGKYSLHFEKAGYNTIYQLHESEDSLTEITYVMYESEISLLSTHAENFYSENDIHIYPNPATDYCNIQINPSTATSEKNIRISIYGTDGKLLKNCMKNTDANGEIRLNLQEMPKSLLLIRVQSDKINVSQKLLRR
ncbi:MAG: T9SS type A sorting domain-containing protein [Bacteroidales bacterium]|jgi:hypothetical protein|nr:T9SS type A sorting domain-containing protein [Bacteroidales bacterium]